jgi:hypothetical protein
MKRHLRLWTVALVSVSVLFLSCGREEALQRELEPIRGESIFDRVVNIEPEIYTEIPAGAINWISRNIASTWVIASFMRMKRAKECRSF